MNKIEDLDFRYYGVEIEYDRCSCSCGKIDNIEVTSIDLNQITETVYKYLDLNTELDRYCVENKNYEIEQDGGRIEIWFKETFDRDSGYFHYLELHDVLIINGEVVTNLEDFCNKLLLESNLW